MDMAVIYTDCHWHAPNACVFPNQNDLIEDCKFLDRYFHERGKYPFKLISLGDNWDLANCLKSQALKVFVEKQTWALNKHLSHIDGNHERDSKTNEVLIYMNSQGRRICMVHGDFESWGAEKAIAYRSKDHGAGPLKRKLLVPLIEKYESLELRKIFDEEMIQRSVSTAISHKSQVIVMGHFHPKLIVKHYDAKSGVTIIVLPRGRNELDLDAL